MSNLGVCIHTAWSTTMTTYQWALHSMLLAAASCCTAVSGAVAVNDLKELKRGRRLVSGCGVELFSSMFHPHNPAMLKQNMLAAEYAQLLFYFADIPNWLFCILFWFWGKNEFVSWVFGVVDCKNKKVSIITNENGILNNTGLLFAQSEHQHLLRHKRLCNPLP